MNGDTAGGVATHLALADHMHELDTGEDDAQAAEILEAHHRPDDAFDRTMVLFHNIVQVLSDPDRHFLFGVQGINGGQVRVALVDGVLAERLFEQRHKFDDPAVHRRVVNVDTALAYHFFEIAQTQRISHIPPHAYQNYIKRIVKALEYLADSGRQRRLRLRHSGLHVVGEANSTAVP